jgi:hypothetical protein
MFYKVFKIKEAHSWRPGEGSQNLSSYLKKQLLRTELFLQFLQAASVLDGCTVVDRILATGLAPPPPARHLSAAPRRNQRPGL